MPWNIRVEFLDYIAQQSGEEPDDTTLSLIQQLWNNDRSRVLSDAIILAFTQSPSKALSALFLFTAYSLEYYLLELRHPATQSLLTTEKVLINPILRHLYQQDKLEEVMATMTEWINTSETPLQALRHPVYTALHLVFELSLRLPVVERSEALRFKVGVLINLLDTHLPEQDIAAATPSTFSTATTLGDYTQATSLQILKTPTSIETKIEQIILLLNRDVDLLLELQRYQTTIARYEEQKRDLLFLIKQVRMNQQARPRKTDEILLQELAFPLRSLQTLLPARDAFPNTDPGALCTLAKQQLPQLQQCLFQEQLKIYDALNKLPLDLSPRLKDSLQLASNDELRRLLIPCRALKETVTTSFTLIQTMNKNQVILNEMNGLSPEIDKLIQTHTTCWVRFTLWIAQFLGDWCKTSSGRVLESQQSMKAALAKKIRDYSVIIAAGRTRLEGADLTAPLQQSVLDLQLPNGVTAPSDTHTVQIYKLFDTLIEKTPEDLPPLLAPSA